MIEIVFENMQELMCQLEDMHQDRDDLCELGDELRGYSTELQVQDIDHKTADAQEKFSQLQDAITNRYVFIILLIFVL